VLDNFVRDRWDNLLHRGRIAFVHPYRLLQTATTVSTPGPRARRPSTRKFDLGLIARGSDGGAWMIS
jgi:hypothetical protein